MKINYASLIYDEIVEANKKARQEDKVIESIELTESEWEEIQSDRRLRFMVPNCSIVRIPTRYFADGIEVIKAKQ